MSRFLSFTNLATKGMIYDDASAGGMMLSFDVLPWRGALRRRGPIKALGQLGPGASGVTTDSTQSFVASDATMLGANKIIASLNTTTPCMYSSADGATWSSININGTTPAIGRWFSAGGEMLGLPLAHTSGSSIAPVVRFSGAPSSASTAGTYTATTGSKRVTFTATHNMSPGMYLILAGGTGYLIDATPTTTSVILAEPSRTTGSVAGPPAWTGTIMNVSSSATGGSMFMQANAGAFGAAFNQVEALAGCYHQGRVFFANIKEAIWDGTAGDYKTFTNRIRWSSLPSESDSLGFKGKQCFNPNATLDLGEQGGDITGLASFQGALVVLRRSAIQVITGGFSSSGSDLGATVNTVATNVGCTNATAFDQFDGGIAFADEKGVYVWDGSAVSNLTRGKIEDYYRYTFAPQVSKGYIVSTPGNRIVVSYASGTTDLVYDFGSSAWFGMASAVSRSNMNEYNGKYVAVSNRQFSSGASAYVKAYNFYQVFENLNTSTSSSYLLDADDTTYLGPKPYIMTNPIELVDGFNQGRVSSIIINDGGSAPQGGVTYTARLYRGPMYSNAAGDAPVTSQVLATSSVPVWTTANPDQRSVQVRTDGSESATHASIELSVTPTITDTFYFAINDIGIFVEDNPGYVSA